MFGEYLLVDCVRLSCAQIVTLSLSNLEHKCRSLVVMVFPPSSHAREFRGKLLAGWWCGFALSNQFSMGGELVNELELQMSESHLAENQPSNEIEIRPTDPLSLPPLPLFDLFFQPKWQLLSWIFGSCGIFTIGRLSAFNLVFAKEREKRRGIHLRNRGRLRSEEVFFLAPVASTCNLVPPCRLLPSRLVFRCCFTG